MKPFLAQNDFEASSGELRICNKLLSDFGREPCCIAFIRHMEAVGRTDQVSRYAGAPPLRGADPVSAMSHGLPSRLGCSRLEREPTRKTLPRCGWGATSKN